MVSEAAGQKVTVQTIRPSEVGHVVVEFCMPADCTVFDEAPLKRLVGALGDPHSALHTSEVGRRYFEGCQLFHSADRGSGKIWPEQPSSVESAQGDRPADAQGNGLRQDGWFAWLFEPKSTHRFTVLGGAMVAAALVTFVFCHAGGRCAWPWWPSSPCATLGEGSPRQESRAASLSRTSPRVVGHAGLAQGYDSQCTGNGQARPNSGLLNPQPPGGPLLVEPPPAQSPDPAMAHLLD